jgi:cathepsin D
MPLFDPSKSTSLQTSSSSVTIRYGSGTVLGNLAKDTISMGGFTVAQQTWCQYFQVPLALYLTDSLVTVTQTTAQIVSGSVSGIMGLAFSAIAATGATPFWQSLVNNNLLQAPEMSFFLTRFVNVPTATEEEPGGVFTLGGTNATFFKGDIDFVNMPSSVQTSFWLLQLSCMFSCWCLCAEPKFCISPFCGR